nr:hypothetical protein [uncultured Marinifilum sp.]
MEREKLISEMINYVQIDLDNMFFGTSPEIRDLKNALSKNFRTIDEIKKIPIKKRNYG